MRSLDSSQAMPFPPNDPKLYHIVHVNNLASIIADGCLWSDAEMRNRQGHTPIGMETIKQRRLALPVSCHKTTYVGDYVPFYFCSRSIMLYVIYCRNHPELVYRGGQETIVHLEANLHETVRWAEANGLRWAIAVPPLGAGLGGLPWESVRSRIEKSLSGIAGVDVTVYEPVGTPDPRAMSHTREVPKMTPGRAALIALIHRYLSGLMDPFVTLLEVHKLMYFMQEAGAPLRLEFKKHYYGPYAQNLTHVLRQVEGHFISGYADGGDQPDKALELVPGAVSDAANFLEDDRETKTRLNRVGDLVAGFETPFGLELLATVHWVAKNEGASTARDAFAKVRAWNDRKKRFSQPQVTLTLRTLKKKGWLESAVSS